MSFIPIPEKDYSDGRTKQSFKESCDINNILKRAQQAGGSLHLQQYQTEYGDFADFDYMEAVNKVARAREIFDHLPHEIKSEFHQNPAAFLAFANDPQNEGRLDSMFRALARPGRQLADIEDHAPRPIPTPPGPPDAPPGPESANPEPPPEG